MSQPKRNFGPLIGIAITVSTGLAIWGGIIWVLINISSTIERTM